MADTASAIQQFQQFQQQIDFFRAKLNLPTERWDDVKQSAHDRAFMVAGAQKANRFINAEDQAPEFVRDVLADRQRTDPLWLGFVEDPQRLSQATGMDVTGYTVLLPAEAPRHVHNAHAFDGQGQHPAAPDDFAHLIGLLNSAATAFRSGDPSRYNTPTVVATGEIAGEIFRSVWDVLPGKRNRSLQLASLVIKTAQK